MSSKNPGSAPVSATGFTIPFMPQSAWPKEAIETSATLCAELLSFSAKRLQAQADFFQGMAACSDISDFFKRESEFVQGAWESYVKEFPRMLDRSKVLGPTGKETH